MEKLFSVFVSLFNQYLPFLCLFVVIGAFSVVITVYDKKAAKKRKKRIPENFLMLTAFCGGAIPMLITMKIIHHKTQHNKFMLGLPAIILIHLIAAIGLMYMRYC
ncbi:MAG: DUF1294 domain-containing protein [Clostridia bacterium]|nr:DUF1294 domain-containing protein [Clostridia bacterium]